MSCMAQSVMARTGPANGNKGERHSLTVSEQGAFRHVCGPLAKPALRVAAGSGVSPETHDALAERNLSESDTLPERLSFPSPNSQTGPIRSGRASLGIAAISSLQPDDCGGIMDMPHVAQGAIIFLPVHPQGGRLCHEVRHAIQGDREPCAAALEIPATGELQIDLIKGHGNGPRQPKTEEMMMFIGFARPLEDATRIAYRAHVRCLAHETGQSEVGARRRMTRRCKARLCNMVGLKYSVGASVAKRYLSGSADG